ncbi:hypothetical protein PRIPAC_90721 [Pristionchus pacificus]|uniref:Uncharacterized protein n=1 Tax=Pristionchus pacificus TaxID=54126 RepID=A0A2A6B956_PRIPA|nr:hypothetical protein PRIPAC_90721 [Pristionchus pacificus]|eukprot:PDM62422.1 hypothetical protein PRIPAC_51864 [Pristionchus pacificus]
MLKLFLIAALFFPAFGVKCFIDYDELSTRKPFEGESLKYALEGRRLLITIDRSMFRIFLLPSLFSFSFCMKCYYHNDKRAARGWDQMEVECPAQSSPDYCIIAVSSDEVQYKSCDYSNVCTDLNEQSKAIKAHGAFTLWCCKGDLCNR